jgi:hypothetical protein
MLGVDHERSRSSDHYVARVRQPGNGGLDVGLSGDGCFQDMFHGVAEDLAYADGSLG